MMESESACFVEFCSLFDGSEKIWIKKYCVLRVQPFTGDWSEQRLWVASKAPNNTCLSALLLACYVYTRTTVQSTFHRRQNTIRSIIESKPTCMAAVRLHHHHHRRRRWLRSRSRCVASWDTSYGSVQCMPLRNVATRTAWNQHSEWDAEVQQHTAWTVFIAVMTTIKTIHWLYIG